jgi:XRE family transcriptional regulator, regulator of sulfur utilization
VARSENRMPAVELATYFGRNLARCRRRAAMSQEELGSLASLHRTEIGMLERGIRLPRIDTLIKLAGALEVPPGELLEGLEWTPGSPRVGRFRMREDAGGDPKLN